MKIKVNGYEFEVEEGDKIVVCQHLCDICGHHTEMWQKRNGETIKHVEPPY